MSQENLERPSLSPQNPVTRRSLDELRRLQEVYELMDIRASKLAEDLFDQIVIADDYEVLTGNISCQSSDSEIMSAISILNRLFKFSRKGHDQKEGGYRIIDQEMLADLDSRTYVMAMMFDGGESARLFCEIVNTENQARIPKTILAAKNVEVQKVFGILDELSALNPLGDDDNEK